jgi:cell division protein FtsQ
MWDNPRTLNLAAGALVGIALFVFAAAGAVALLRSPLFPVTRIDLTHPLGNTGRQEIEAAARARIRGNFFAIDPSEVRAGLEALPWVRRASVRRVWPDRLAVTLEEHVAFARWGERELLNSFGERFHGESDAALPVFLGPAGSEREMMLRYARFAAAVAPLKAGVERLVLSPRRAWQLRLDSGLQVMLGRDADRAEARLARFVEVYAATLGAGARQYQYVDLRYPNGFALRLPEWSS